ncbi:hypothetical protein MT325_m164L [Paramecium bursaria chlorella virus MT325]|uniref:Uncharacterized protein m164L n=1 Tax=Paramecium bursaria Chlorella virus MT325 TaxID=346932 RepID=A7ITP4_PBCVM|nr:hypothetical protein MT325_m164L [Paramecium bursaria chlorella virus MT325]
MQNHGKFVLKNGQLLSMQQHEGRLGLQMPQAWTLQTWQMGCCSAVNARAARQATTKCRPAARMNL